MKVHLTNQLDANKREADVLIDSSFQHTTDGQHSTYPAARTFASL